MGMLQQLSERNATAALREPRWGGSIRFPRGSLCKIDHFPLG